MGAFVSIVLEIIVELVKMVWEGACILSRALLNALADSPAKKVALQSTGVASKLSTAAPSPKPTESSKTQPTATPLPKLPVPNLRQTAEKFLSTVKPLTNDTEYTRTEKLVADFLKPESTSHKLQELLEKRAQNTDNWLSDWWTNVAYLDFRLPICGHVSPGYFLPFFDFKGLQGQISAAAKMVTGLLDLKSKIENDALPTEKMGGKPLCMVQYKGLFNSCRVPGAVRDSVVAYPKGHPEEPDHITVIRNNHFFSVPVYGTDRRPLSTNQIVEQLNHVVEESYTKAPPVGILTADGRDHWYKAYEKLSQDPQNKANFHDIQRSICIICLDKPATSSNGGKQDVLSVYLNQTNNAGGSKNNAANRWFDKTAQILVGPEGFVSATSEHTLIEGPPILFLLEYGANFVKKGISSQEAAEGVKPPKRLDFNVTADVRKMMETSEENIDAMVRDMDLVGFRFADFGKNFIKSQKMSPDAFIQVAIQLAFYKLYGHSTASYESGSLRMFQRGRTDTIRSCSIASHSYCQAMTSDKAFVAEKALKLKMAVNAHRQYTDEVIRGQGIDRHLLGLRMIAKENDIALPDLLKDPVYEKSCTFRISTSQVASKLGGVISFGPVVPDGYGLCYNPMDDAIMIMVSSWNSSKDTSTTRMRQSLTEALREARDVLLEAEKKSATTTAQ